MKRNLDDLRQGAPKLTKVESRSKLKLAEIGFRNLVSEKIEYCMKEGKDKCLSALYLLSHISPEFPEKRPSYEELMGMQEENTGWGSEEIVQVLVIKKEVSNLRNRGLKSLEILEKLSHRIGALTLSAFNEEKLQTTWEEFRLTENKPLKIIPNDVDTDSTVAYSELEKLKLTKEEMEQTEVMEALTDNLVETETSVVDDPVPLENISSSVEFNELFNRKQIIALAAYKTRLASEKPGESSVKTKARKRASSANSQTVVLSEPKRRKRS